MSIYIYTYIYTRESVTNFKHVALSKASFPFANRALCDDIPFSQRRKSRAEYRRQGGGAAAVRADYRDWDFYTLGMGFFGMYQR